MKYLQIAGLMADKIDIDVDAPHSPSIDLEKMEAKEVSGFDFVLPVQLFEKFYQADDFELEIPHDFLENDTDIEFDNTVTEFNEGDLVWIKNELVQVDSIVDTFVTFTRGMYNTFKQQYIRREQQPYYVRKYAKSFIGQRVFLWEDDKLLSIGLITEQPLFNGLVLEFNCENAITALDIDFTLPEDYYDVKVDDEKLVSVASINTTLKTVGYRHNMFEYEMPPILDYIDFSGLDDNFLPGGNRNNYVKISSLSTIMDFLKLFGKANGKVFTYNSFREVYAFINISDVSSLDSVGTVTIGNYINIKESYTSQVYTGISQISIKTDSGAINVNNVNTSQFAQKYNFELDLTDFSFLIPSSLLNIAFFYTRLFSIIYSKLTIPSHEIIFDLFQEGYFYDISDIDQFQTFQDVSSRAFCLSKDKKEISFLITRNAPKNPVAPGIPVSVVSDSVSHDIFQITKYLTTDQDKIADAKINDYDYKYFDGGDACKFIRNDGTVFDNLVIDSIVDRTITFVSPTLLTNGDIGYLTYSSFSNCTARQKIFFFLNNNNW